MAHMVDTTNLPTTKTKTSSISYHKESFHNSDRSTSENRDNRHRRMNKPMEDTQLHPTYFDYRNPAFCGKTYLEEYEQLAVRDLIHLKHSMENNPYYEEPVAADPPSKLSSTKQGRVAVEYSDTCLHQEPSAKAHRRDSDNKNDDDHCERTYVSLPSEKDCSEANLSLGKITTSSTGRESTRNEEDVDKKETGPINRRNADLVEDKCEKYDKEAEEQEEEEEEAGEEKEDVSYFDLSRLVPSVIQATYRDGSTDAADDISSVSASTWSHFPKGRDFTEKQRDDYLSRELELRKTQMLLEMEQIRMEYQEREKDRRERHERFQLELRLKQERYEAELQYRQAFMAAEQRRIELELKIRYRELEVQLVQARRASIEN